MLTPKDIAKMIDHSLLRPELDVETVKKGLAVAKKYGTATVCVRPCDLGLAREALAGTEVGLCTVIGFPHGSNETAVKVFEAERAMDAGATELDMVLNIGRLLSGEEDYVRQDIQAVVEAAHARGAIVKHTIRLHVFTIKLIHTIALKHTYTSKYNHFHTVIWMKV